MVKPQVEGLLSCEDDDYRDSFHLDVISWEDYIRVNG